MTSDARQDSDPALGRYANYFEIGYNEFEIVLAFGQRYADSAAETFHTRIVAGPSYAKTLLEMLERTIREYEDKYGPIT